MSGYVLCDTYSYWCDAVFILLMGGESTWSIVRVNTWGIHCLFGYLVSPTETIKLFHFYGVAVEVLFRAHRRSDKPLPKREIC